MHRQYLHPVIYLMIISNCTNFSVFTHSICDLIQDKEGVLYESEILGLLTEVNEQDFTQLSKALEMEKSSTNDSEDKMLNLCIWSRIMGDLARSHLVYHLNRIGLSKCAKR